MFGLLMPGGIFRYVATPEIGSRFQSLFMSGFHYVPFFIAVVYQMVGLLPRSHPYLNQSNLGRYGIRHVVFEAASNIKFGLKNIDQIIMFAAVLVGLVIFLVQILSLGSFMFLQPAIASMPTNWAGFFTIENPLHRSQDLAYQMLDMVFGVPHPIFPTLGFFESCIGSPLPCLDNFGIIPDIDLSLTTVPTGMSGQFGPLSSTAYTQFPFPYHLGMHRLFTVYSNGLLVIAVMITSYFVVTVVAETAQSGTPFGKRFNKTWAPLRIVIAFGLLMPLGSSLSIPGLFGYSAGLNSSQYIVLYAAKYGSAFASNGWRLFNETLTTSYLGEPSSLVTVPNTPELGYLTQFMYVARVCKAASDWYEKQIWLKEATANHGNLPDERAVHMYALWKKDSDANNTWKVPVSAFYSLLILNKDAEFNNISFVFGIKGDKYTEDRNNVSPVCGELNLQLTDPRIGGAIPFISAEPGPLMVQEAYFDLIKWLWYVGIVPLSQPPIPPEILAAGRRHLEVAGRKTEGLGIPPTDNIRLNSEYVQAINNSMTTFMEGRIATAVDSQAGSTRLTANVNDDLPLLSSKGWAAAGLWYNRVAEMNGSLISATYAVPTIIKYPAIQEEVSSLKLKYNKEVDEDDQHKPEATGIAGIAHLLKDAHGFEFAQTLYTAEYEWGTGGVTKEKLKGNAFLDAISSILGLNGLYDMRKNPDAHPLAMLVGIGRSLVESAIKSLGYAAIASMFAASGVAGALGTISASFFVSIAMMGLTVGFVLFYVVPFLPFIYFFFAVGGWIKGIFEAMVGAPLWALAHIRIDGEGLPGQAAMNGYYLIFEVFLRPILIVFGLLASISIFSALVSVLNIIFSVVTSNVGGFDKSAEMDPSIVIKALNFSKSRIDEFFFTVIYAIIVYLIGMSSFKLIDNIPNNILRWMGQSVATFGDQRENPAEGLVSKTTVGSQQALSKIGGGLQSAVQGAGKVGS